LIIKTAVVILNWNGKSFLERFLPLLIERTPGAEIIIADNASSDDSVEFMKTNFPQIRLIINDKNYGFAGGYNMALKQVEADYYVLLNSDIEVDHNWLEPLVEALERNPDAAACQPKIIDYHRREYFEYAGASGGFIDKNGFPFCRGRIFSTLEKDHGQYDDEIEIFWASGACMLVRAKIYHELGGLDDDFFAHMEEIDFCWRLLNAGKKVLVVPQSRVFHIGGGTLPKKSSRKTYLNFRNNYLLLYKNLPSNKIFPILTKRLFLDWIAVVVFVFQGHFGDAMAVAKAQRHFYFSFKKHRHKREGMTSFSRSHIYNRSIILSYHLRRKRTFDKLVAEKFLR